MPDGHIIRRPQHHVRPSTLPFLFLSACVSVYVCLLICVCREACCEYRWNPVSVNVCTDRITLSVSTSCIVSSDAFLIPSSVQPATVRPSGWHFVGGCGLHPKVGDRIPSAPLRQAMLPSGDGRQTQVKEITLRLFRRLAFFVLVLTNQLDYYIHTQIYARSHICMPAYARLRLI